MRGHRKRVMVTGGAGFLGSHLCDVLVGKGYDVLCLDNYYTGVRDNIAHLLANPHFELIRHDVTFPLYVEVDEIYNFACPASPIHYQFDPVATTKTSVHGAIKDAGIGQTHPRQDLAGIDQRGLWRPQRPSANRIVLGQRQSDRHCAPAYDEGKRCAETLFFDYHRQNNVQIKVARIFNTYGPRMHPNDGRVVSNSIVQALKGDAITIYGDGMQTRSFCYVDDLIDGCVRFMENTGTDEVGPINLGNPHEFTMLALAETVIRMTASSSRIEFRPLPADDPRQRQPDITRAQQTLEWTPRWQLQEGLERTIAYFRKLAD